MFNKNTKSLNIFSVVIYLKIETNFYLCTPIIAICALVGYLSGCGGTGRPVYRQAGTLELGLENLKIIKIL